ncbi:MAG: hypothetical protein JEZ11_26440 [Desulfobacterales bacterium]|nr:hypothetical protein [Desulfobacterales bacterium]
MVNLRLLHPALPAGIIKELDDDIKGLIRIVDNIGKPSALTVFKERIARDCHTWQTGLQFIDVTVIRQTKYGPTNFTGTNIVSMLPVKARANLLKMPFSWLNI